MYVCVSSAYGSCSNGSFFSDFLKNHPSEPHCGFFVIFYLPRYLRYTCTPASITGPFFYLLPFFSLAHISFSIYTFMIPTCFHVPLLEVPACMYGRIPTYSINRYVEGRQNTYNDHPPSWYSIQNTLYHRTIYAQGSYGIIPLFPTYFYLGQFRHWVFGRGTFEIQSTFVFSSSPLFFFYLSQSI